MRRVQVLIRGGIRLGILYLLVWAVSVVWDGGGAFYREGVERTLEFFPLAFEVDLFAAFLCMACAWHTAGFWLWVYTVKGSHHKAVFRHPLPAQPLRHYFRLRMRRPTGAAVTSLLGLLFALQALQQLQFSSFASGPFALVYTFPLLPDLGSRGTPWLVYGVAHLGVVAFGWWLLGAMAGKRHRPSRDGSNAFVQYQVRRNPVAQVFAIVVLLAHLPLASITAAASPHPFHGVVVLCSLAGMSLAALVGQAVSLGIMRRHDIWFAALIEQARRQGPASEEYIAWESTLTFLTGEKPLPLDGYAGMDSPPFTEKGDKAKAWSGFFSKKRAARTAGAKPSHAAAGEAKPRRTQAQASRDGEKLLARAKTYLKNNKAGKARALLQRLTEHEDLRVRQHADELLSACPAKDASRFSLLRIARMSAVAALAVGVVITLGVALQWSTLPGADETRQLARSAHFHVKKKNVQGKSRVTLFGNRYDYSLNISRENIAEAFQQAVIASEDHRFYEHSAPYILAKFAQAGAMCAASKLNPLSGGACHGNSTLAQQLARNLFLSEQRSVARKLSELLWALKMETGLSKDEILNLYMNRIYLGNGNYGVEMAARDYFQKKASDLETTEAAYLAAAIKRPGWNWHQDREGASQRARLILALMRQHGYTDADHVLPENFRPWSGNRQVHKPYLGHLWQWAKSDIAPIMQSMPDGNYKVLTSLNAEVQIYAEKALHNEVARLQKRGKPVSQGAVVVMRPDGQVLAMAGGVGERGRYFNRAKRTEGLLPRPPASAFKPFVYLAALESGLEPDSRIYAGPVSIPMQGSAKPYQPRNHDGKQYAYVSLRDGLVHSINTAAVHLLYSHVGFERLFGTVERLGIAPDTMRKQWGVALGQNGVSLIEMTAAYCVFANGGKAVQPYTVRAITSESGKTIWHRPEEKAKQVFRREDISDLNSMLRDVVRYGTGRRATEGLSGAVMLAGKTGTGDGFVDAWFIGYTADLVIGVWLGNDQPTTMDGVYGGTGPARVYNDLMRKLIDYTDITSGTGALP